MSSFSVVLNWRCIRCGMFFAEGLEKCNRCLGQMIQDELHKPKQDEALTKAMISEPTPEAITVERDHLKAENERLRQLLQRVWLVLSEVD